MSSACAVETKTESVHPRARQDGLQAHRRLGRQEYSLTQSNVGEPLWTGPSLLGRDRIRELVVDDRRQHRLALHQVLNEKRVIARVQRALPDVNVRLVGERKPERKKRVSAGPYGTCEGLFAMAVSGLPRQPYVLPSEWMPRHVDVTSVRRKMWRPIDGISVNV